MVYFRQKLSQKGPEMDPFRHGDLLIAGCVFSFRIIGEATQDAEWSFVWLCAKDAQTLYVITEQQDRRYLVERHPFPEGSGWVCSSAEGVKRFIHEWEEERILVGEALASRRK